MRLLTATRLPSRAFHCPVRAWVCVGALAAARVPGLLSQAHVLEHVLDSLLSLSQPISLSQPDGAPSEPDTAIPRHLEHVLVPDTAIPRQLLARQLLACSYKAPTRKYACFFAAPSSFVAWRGALWRCVVWSCMACAGRGGLLVSYRECMKATISDTCRCQTRPCCPRASVAGAAAAHAISDT